MHLRHFHFVSFHENLQLISIEKPAIHRDVARRLTKD